MNPHHMTVLHNVLCIYLEGFHTDLQTKEWIDILIRSTVYIQFFANKNDSLIEKKAITLFEKHKRDLFINVSDGRTRKWSRSN